jgi:hypothetical protein
MPFYNNIIPVDKFKNTQMNPEGIKNNILKPCCLAEFNLSN